MKNLLYRENASQRSNNNRCKDACGQGGKKMAPSNCDYKNNYCRNQHWQPGRFDPATIRDHATFEDPDLYSEGVKFLLVNGILTIDDGHYTGALAGEVILRR